MDFPDKPENNLTVQYRIQGYDEPITQWYMSLVMGHLSGYYNQQSKIIKSLNSFPTPEKKDKCLWELFHFVKSAVSIIL